MHLWSWSSPAAAKKKEVGGFREFVSFPFPDGGGANARGRGGDRDEEIIGDYDGRPLTAIEALKESCATLASQCDMVLEKLMEAAPEVKEDMERMERFAEEDRMNEEEEEEDEGEQEDDE